MNLIVSILGKNKLKMTHQAAAVAHHPKFNISAIVG